MDKAVIDWRQLLNTPLFTISSTTVTLLTLLLICLIIVGTMLASRLAQRGVTRWLGSRGTADSGTVSTVARLVHYVILIIGFGSALQTMGISLGTLFAAGAFFAIAIGFAMQSIAQNFVSGIILLAERTIKPGDVLEVEGRVVRVTAMRMRATVARTRDEEDLIIPNSTLVQNTITNFTLRDSLIRIRTKVGVSYGADLRQVHDVLTRAATALTHDAPREPLVLLAEFADSSVVFEVSIWSEDAWASRRTRSDLNFAIHEALRREDIVIPFPQRDVHLFQAADAGGTHSPVSGPTSETKRINER